LLRIYHARGTRSMRPIWLCHELDIPVEIITIDFSTTFRDTPEWRALSPAGKVPVLSDGALTMLESGAMVDYILERYGVGRLQPAPGTPESALYRQWCWFSEATLVRPIGSYRLARFPTDGSEKIATEIDEKTHGGIAVVEAALTKSDHLPGPEFSAADIMMGYSLALLANLTLLDERYPRSRAYLERLQARPAFQRAKQA